jgi:hypothetical protein
MNCKWLFLVSLLLFPTVFLPLVYFSSNVNDVSRNEDFYFGVTFGGNTTSEAKLLIDKVKGYTNLFVINNWDLALNEAALTEICDCAVDAGMNIMVYFGFVFFDISFLYPRWQDLFTEAGIEPFHTPWLINASDRWGEKFLGAYVLDEPGGKQLDRGHYSGYTTSYSGRNQTTFANVNDYSDAARLFVRGVGRYYVQRLNNASYYRSIPNSTGKVIPVFTADNALYWFDYLAGYDTVFAEFGWNHNEAQHIALCRGAANVQDKQWGAIITWASNDPPYLASGSQMLQQMNTAYYSGAKYLIVFNYPQLNPYGALTDEHFAAMETFWNRIHSFPGNVVEKVTGEVAMVLPKDYGWGMRQADDKIWGLWPADDLSPSIGKKIATLISEYGLKLDIIYDDPQFNYTEKYAKIYYWNSSNSIFVTSMPIIMPSNALYATLLTVAVTVICMPFYVITKRKNGENLKNLSQQ